MNRDSPPLNLKAPKLLPRRTEHGRPFPASEQTIAQRGAKTAMLLQSLAPVKQRLRVLTPAQRRAFFVKLEHTGPINLVGTGLKAISPPSDRVTLAIPRDNNLAKLERKLADYGDGPIQSGMIPNQLLGNRLSQIESGMPFDRVSDELTEQYTQLLEQEAITLEIEISSLENGIRKRSEDFSKIIENINLLLWSGVRGTIYEHRVDRESANVVLRCNGEVLRKLVHGDEWQTVITWLDLPPRFQTFSETLRNFSAPAANISPVETDAPTVCIVDSGIVPGNVFLTAVTRTDMMKSFLHGRAADIYDENGHGSGVGSIASYFALNLATGATNKGDVFLASARILDENSDCPDRLFANALEDVVRFYSPLGVKIFNLSVNVRDRPWNAMNRKLIPKRSWISRTIDQLSRIYDVVFVVSTGNIPMDTVRALLSTHAYPNYLQNEVTSILDPAQAALALTVGSLAATTQIVGPFASHSAIAMSDQPSPFTRKGPGVRNEFKPELVEYGGNYVYDSTWNQVKANPGCNVVIATHELSPSVKTASGTSFAAPKVSHEVASILRDLTSIGVTPSAPLLRAMVVSSAQYPRSAEFQDAAEQLRSAGVDYRNVSGYGVASAARAMYCDDYSVAMFYQGKLQHNKVAMFEIPVPESLINSQGEYKSITVSLAYSPEVHHRGFGDYFGTSIRWRLFRGDTAQEAIERKMAVPEIDSTDDDAENSDRDESVFELQGAHGIQKRSRGSVQLDKFMWKDHRPEYSLNSYILAVTSFEKWNRVNPAPVDYAVVVRVEDQSRRVPIYDLISSNLSVTEFIDV